MRFLVLWSSHGNGALQQTDGASGQLNPTFVIAGAVLTGIGIFLWSLRKGGRWAAPATAAAGVIVLSLGFILPSIGLGGADSDAVVSIVEPRNGAQVAAGTPVTLRVAIQNGSIATSATDTSGGHLHLYVDGQLQQMPYSNLTQVMLQPGPHNLRVEYVDNRHVPFDPPVVATVDVTATGGGGLPA
ncbi:MAG TPA: hypothetical protein VHI54_10050 [Actinomycetota bacterium]|nr:hypothetical protein [Actinomycetota bacterium]